MQARQVARKCCRNGHVLWNEKTQGFSQALTPRVRGAARLVVESVPRALAVPAA
jgi:hypothetical protein